MLFFAIRWVNITQACVWNNKQYRNYNSRTYTYTLIQETTSACWYQVHVTSVHACLLHVFNASQDGRSGFHTEILKSASLPLHSFPYEKPLFSVSFGSLTTPSSDAAHTLYRVQAMSRWPCSTHKCFQPLKAWQIHVQILQIPSPPLTQESMTSSRWFVTLKNLYDKLWMTCDILQQRKSFRPSIKMWGYGESQAAKSISNQHRQAEE